MRALRSPLKFAAGLAGAIALATSAAGAGTAASASGEPARAGSYYPLAVGNLWAYRCSVEAAAAASKVRRIVGVTHVEGRAYYRTTLTVGTDPRPVPSFLSLGEDGSVWEGPLASTQGSAPVVPAPAPAPAPGQRVGVWVVGGTERLQLPALKSAQALRLENFAIDSPGPSAERRNEWLARYYVLGVGPVAEADGLGGQCELTRYRLSAPGGTRAPK